MRGCAQIDDRRAFPHGWSALALPAAKSCLQALVLGAMVFASAGQAQAKRLKPVLPPEDVVPAPGDISLVEEAIIAAAKGQSCTILIGGAGTLAADGSRSTLSSEVPGGIPGTALVSTTNASFSLFYDVPSAFALAPSAFSGVVLFNGNLSGNGATNFLNIASGSQVNLKRGDTNVSVNLSATVQGAAFASGQYATEGVLRCE
ncbi:MAG: hypothetical protein KDJ73_05095 [Notoacmeibacter sp.]|nr:hypothetical protein [Notoacmeibacter sp.]MCC0032731.1 hypothetical protein [Brucellaceae bacterium]